jgi:hypothetical protein
MGPYELEKFPCIHCCRNLSQPLLRGVGRLRCASWNPRRGHPWLRSRRRYRGSRPAVLSSASDWSGRIRHYLSHELADREFLARRIRTIEVVGWDHAAHPLPRSPGISGNVVTFAETLRSDRYIQIIRNVAFGFEPEGREFGISAHTVRDGATYAPDGSHALSLHVCRSKSGNQTTLTIV